MKNQHIGCTTKCCMHNARGMECELASIEIAPVKNAGSSDCKCPDDTKCASFCAK